MRSEDIRSNLEALRREIRSLNDSLVDLRKDELRNVFGEQIKPILMERIDGFCSQLERDGMPPADVRTAMEDSRKMVDRAIVAFQQRGRDEALSSLSLYEVDLFHRAPSSREARSMQFQLDLVQQLRKYFATFEGISRQGMDRTGSLMASTPSKDLCVLSPTAAERALSPLANSWRMSILMLLSREDESLTGLSKSLGLQKGHLQFHLKILLEPGFINYDRKSRLYSITAKGSTALDGIGRLVESLA